MPLLSIIAALSCDTQVIGLNNALPWHLPADLQHFKRLTINKSILMGRKTHESIGRLLPDRHTIILSRNHHYHVPGASTVTSVDAALALVKPEDELMIVGGEQLFSLLMPKSNRLYLTFIEGDFKGDTFFPPINDREWEEISRENYRKDDKNPYNYRFVNYRRRV